MVGRPTACAARRCRPARRLRYGLVVTALVVAAGACGGGSGDADEAVAGTGAPPTTDGTTSPSPAEPTTDLSATTQAAELESAATTVAVETVGCPTPGPPADPAALTTPEALFAAAAVAYGCDGHVLHVVEELDGPDGPVRREVWLDVAADAVRVETTRAGSSGPGHQRELTSGGVHHLLPLLQSADQVVDIDPMPGDPSSCFAGTASVSALLGCPGGEGLTDLAVETVVTTAPGPGGSEVVALTTTFTGHGSNEGGADVRTTTTRLLDPATLLPIGWEERSEIHWLGDGAVEQRDVAGTVTSAFVPADELPPWLFDPEALGRPGAGVGGGGADGGGPVDDLAAAAAPTGVYWLGERWEPGGGLPALDLGTIQPGFTDQDAGVLGYHSEVDDAHRVELRIIPVETWDTDAWETLRSSLGPVCAGPTALADGGSLTVHCSEQQDGTLADGGAAVVTFPDAVVLVGEVYVTTNQPTPTLPDDFGLVTREVAARIAEDLVRYAPPG